MIETGPARRDEFSRIREIVERAFASSDEPDLWDYLVEHDATMTPNCIRVARLGGRIVACTVVLPRSLRSRRRLVPGAIVTLVACDPDHAGQGYGSASVRDAVDFMRGTACAVGILYGHPTYYPRFGFVPVFPRASTRLRARDISPDTAAAFRPLQDSDLIWALELFGHQLGGFPGAVRRSTAPWEWHPRGSALVVAGVEFHGYALVTFNIQDSSLRLHEGACAAGHEEALLAGLGRLAGEKGMATVDLGLPPEHPLALRARALGADTEITPPSAGMAVVLDWHPLLPPGYRVENGALLYGERRVLNGTASLLTALALGSVDLAADPEAADIHIAAGFRPKLLQDFPVRFPHWSLEPFWF